MNDLEQAIAFVERTAGGAVDKASREHFRMALDRFTPTRRYLRFTLPVPMVKARFR